MNKEECKHPYPWQTDVKDGKHGWKCSKCGLFITNEELKNFMDELEDMTGDPSSYIQLYLSKKGKNS